MLKFGRLSDLIDNATDLDVYSMLERIFKQKEVKKIIIELNTTDQLFKNNIDADGIKLYKIGGEYSKFTQSIKRTTGKRVNLFDTGDFYRTFYVEVKKDSIEIYANTFKNGKDLQSRWGDNIVGLTDNNINKLLTKEVVTRLRIELLNILLDG